MRRRSRRRRKPSERSQAPTLPRVWRTNAGGRYDTWETLANAQPAWVHAIWRDSGRSVVSALGWLVLATLILFASFSDPPVGFTGRARGVLWAAVALVTLFGSVLVQAVQDQRRGENRVPAFFSVDRFLRTGPGVAALLAHIAVTAALYRAFPD